MEKKTDINMIDGGNRDQEAPGHNSESLANILLQKTMDQARFNKILEIAGKDDQLRLKVLYNAGVKCLQDYNAESTAARLKDWQAAEKALGELLDQIEKNGREPDPESRGLHEISDVLEYLIETGWRVSKPTLYRHHKEKKFTPGTDGIYRRKDIDKYAKTWLKQQATGKKVKELEDQLQRQILEEELATAKEKRRKIERENSRADGELIDRREVENWLAGRAGILEAGLKHWIQSGVAEWIRMARGDLKTAGELINTMIRDLDEHINSYAQTKEFEVMIDGEEEEIETRTEGR
jgi:hypothetical protein